MKTYLLTLALLIFSLCSSQTQKRSISDYDKLIEINPAIISNYFDRGLLKFEERDFSGAIFDFDVVIDNDSKNVNALYNRALSKAEINDTA